MEHLVLVVHGIGDALMSVDLGVVQLRSLVECCDTMRAHHEEVRYRGGRRGRGLNFSRERRVQLRLRLLLLCRGGHVAALSVIVPGEEGLTERKKSGTAMFKESFPR